MFICNRALAASDSAGTSDETEAKKDDQDQEQIERFKAAKAAEGTGLPGAEVREPKVKPAGARARATPAEEVAPGGLQGRSFLVDSDSGRRSFEAGLQRTN